MTTASGRLARGRKADEGDGKNARGLLGAGVSLLARSLAATYYDGRSIPRQVNEEVFASLAEASAVIERWLLDDNHVRRARLGQLIYAARGVMRPKARSGSYRLRMPYGRRRGFRLRSPPGGILAAHRLPAAG